MKAILLSILLATTVLAGEKPSAESKNATQRIAFSQFCFWTGEMKLGQIDGVVRTEAGFLDGHEVTVVDYLPTSISLPDLVRQAKAAGVADRIHFQAGAPSIRTSVGLKEGAPLDRSYQPAPASDQKKQLEGTPLARLALTPEQATKLNAFYRVDPAKAARWLTPAQRSQLQPSR
ncbi:MAG: hypothetical protein ABI946_03860 [Chthoniobacterales bacterium]